MRFLILLVLFGVAATVVASRFKDVDTVARTIYAEAGGEGTQGMKAVASVIVNRSERRNLSPQKVCLQPFQFSCWNNGKPVRHDNSAWRFAEELALQVCEGKFEPIGPWTHYCRVDCHPSWREKMTKQVIIGNHIFGVLDE